ncbi:MAG: molybdopterin-dependent oxidoreductase [Anaerolineales bacterium]|nr:molybdopterin-dependent oxidoreductase [Anaerolineales bacterium]
MTERTRVRTNCRFCGYLCGLIAAVEDGRVTDIEPDPSRYPFDANLQSGCRRWRANLEFLDHPDRVNYPLKRVGERGSGKWRRLSWDEALEDIAARLQDLKERYNPEALATSIGGPHATYWPLHRFMSLFGSPNNIGIGQICWNPGVWINSLTYGWPVENELDPDTTACVILWGTNPAESDNSLFWRRIVQFSRTDKPLIVVDPRQTRTAMRATLWLPVRPGTDAFLALGMLRVILAEKLYDAGFVERWCHGFDELESHVAAYPPDVVAGITGVEAGKIREAARLYALHSPASLISGRGIDQLGRNSAPTHQALAILRAVTGNLDVAGASHLCEMPDFIPEVDLELSAALPEAQRMKGLNQGRLMLQSYRGYEHVQKHTQRHDKRLPMRYLTSAHPNLAWQAMLTGKPYPVRALIVMGSNPLLTQADTHLVYQALKSLDLLVVLEFFKTPTAMLADYILPSAGGMERPLFQTHAGIANIAYGGEQAVQPYYERRSDFDFWRELGLRLGQTNGWPWKTFHASLEATLEPSSITWRQFCESGLYHVPSPYQKHEQIDPATGIERGFATPSRKVELCSQTLAELGYKPLPTPELTPVSNDGSSLLLITGARKQPFNASALRQMEDLRAANPEPVAEMSAETAARLGLADGCPLLVETEYGEARFILKVAPMREDVVSVEYGWWYPEMPACEPDLGGVWVSNANVLTSANIETSDPLIGTWTYNGLPCRVFAVEAAMERTYER